MSEIAPVTIHLTREQLLAYAAASGDHNPIHQDDAAAQALGLPGVIAHGMWSMGAALSVLAEPVRTVKTKFASPLVVEEAGAVLIVSGERNLTDKSATLFGVDADGAAIVTLEVSFA